MNPDILTGSAGIAIIIFLAILSILWFLLPFAVFGIKKRLDKLIELNEQLVILLQISTNTSDANISNDAKIKIEPRINL
ncbi:MAG: hypothetical protein P8Z75_14950 [Gammaproteobacteria bacterium]|jgi:hypothetical protein